MVEPSAIDLFRQLRQLYDEHHADGKPPTIGIPHWLMNLLSRECRELWEDGRQAMPCPFGDPTDLYGMRVIRVDPDFAQRHGFRA